jgi:hypothetical protein
LLAFITVSQYFSYIRLQNLDFASTSNCIVVKKGCVLWTLCVIWLSICNGSLDSVCLFDFCESKYSLKVVSLFSEVAPDSYEQCKKEYHTSRNSCSNVQVAVFYKVLDYGLNFCVLADVEAALFTDWHKFVAHLKICRLFFSLT